jgi:hypothetical protein
MHPTALHRAHVRAAILCGVLSSVGFAACIDPLHLDPVNAGAGGTAAASTGSAPSGCHSNPDCTFPKAICNTVTGACVECLVASDCAYMPGAVCSKGACECPPGHKCGTLSGGSSSSASTGTGGAGTGGDGGVEASVPCVSSCAEALTNGAPVCPDAGAFPVYQGLGFCAGCNAAGGCTPVCAATLCADKPVEAGDAGTPCSDCLATACTTLYNECLTE